MRISVLTFILLTCGALSCTQGIKTTGNQYCKIIVDKNGPAIRENEFAAITYVQKTDDGIVVHDTAIYDNRPTYMFREPSFFKGDVFDALGNLSEGDSAVFKISIDSMIKKNDFNAAKYPKSKYMIYNVRVNKVIPRNGNTGVEYNKAIETYKQQVEDATQKSESAEIQKYIRLNHLKPQVTASGINYVVKRLGTGKNPSDKNNVLVNYTGKTLDGQVFETTSAIVAQNAGINNKGDTYGPMKIPVVKGKTLSGFDQAITMFPKYTRVMLIFPSKLAYGATTYKGLPPFTPVICELEIVDIL